MNRVLVTLATVKQLMSQILLVVVKTPVLVAVIAILANVIKVNVIVTQTNVVN